MLYFIDEKKILPPALRARGINFVVKAKMQLFTVMCFLLFLILSIVPVTTQIKLRFPAFRICRFTSISLLQAMRTFSSRHVFFTSFQILRKILRQTAKNYLTQKRKHTTNNHLYKYCVTIITGQDTTKGH